MQNNVKKWIERTDPDENYIMLVTQPKNTFQNLTIEANSLFGSLP